MQPAMNAPKNEPLVAHSTPQERYLQKPFMFSSHSWAKNLLSDLTEGSSVLDIGPGSGVMGEFLRGQGAYHLTAVEIDEDARAHIGGIYDVICSEPKELNPEQKFDVILLLDVVEHVPNSEEFLFTILKYLKPGGRLFFSVPNIAHWSIRLMLLFGFFESQRRGILDATHLQHFTRKRVLNIFNQTKFFKRYESSLSLEPVEFVLPKWIWDNEVFKLLRTLQFRVSKLFPGLCAYQHLVVAESPGED